MRSRAPRRSGSRATLPNRHTSASGARVRSGVPSRLRHLQFRAFGRSTASCYLQATSGCSTHLQTSCQDFNPKVAGSIPARPIGYRMPKRARLSYAGQACRRCRECSWGAHPGAHPERETSSAQVGRCRWSHRAAIGSFIILRAGAIESLIKQVDVPVRVAGIEVDAVFLYVIKSRDGDVLEQARREPRRPAAGSAYSVCNCRARRHHGPAACPGCGEAQCRLMD